MKITDYLKCIGYDYMPLPIGDGIADDTQAIQNRIDEDMYAFDGQNGSKFRTKEALKFKVDIVCNKKGRY